MTACLTELLSAHAHRTAPLAYLHTRTSRKFLPSPVLWEMIPLLTSRLSRIGYGPPDTITIDLSEQSVPSCTAEVSTGFRDFEIGMGHVNCGSAADTLDFYGDSNKDSGNTGTVNYNGNAYTSYAACNGTPHYSASFPLSCTRDAGGNATCGLGNGAVTLNLLSFM